MGETIQLQAADGHRLDGWLARPLASRAAGWSSCRSLRDNSHIRRVTESFAAGYLAVAPALFDRVRRGRRSPMTR